MKRKNTLLTACIHTVFMTLLMLIPLWGTSNTTLFINQHNNAYTDFNLAYFIEPDGTFFDIEDIQKTNFEKITNNNINLGYEKNEIWFRLDINNSTSKHQEMILELTEVYFDYVNLYRFSAGKLISYEENGLKVPIEKRRIKEPLPSFALNIAPHETQTLYLKIKTKNHGIATAINLKKKKVFLQDIHTKKYLYFAYFVMLATIILYNLIYYLYFKDQIYFHYIVYITLFSLWVANYKGLIISFSNTQLYHELQIIIPIFFISLFYFSQAILETKQKYPALHKWMNGMIALSLVTVLYMLVNKENSLFLFNIISIVLLLILIGSTLWYLKKTPFHLLYLLALGTFVSGMMILALMTLGFIAYNYWLSNLVVLLSIVEIGLFSLLFVYRINLIRRQSLKSREKLLEQQKTESTRLFHAVAEKTKELKQAKKELELELQKKAKLEKHLQHLASTDPMTELYNRRAFFEISDLEVSGAKIDKEKLTCLLIDIDHFKNINDTYGHDAGDIVITSVAKMMISNTRDKDHIGRIGGEEFAILMPKTDADAAYLIADRLRENISRHAISIHNHHTLKVTVSIGLSSLNHHSEETIHTLLKRADNALYQAKNNGRNQVCCLPSKSKNPS